MYSFGYPLVYKRGYAGCMPGMTCIHSVHGRRYKNQGQASRTSARTAYPAQACSTMTSEAIHPGEIQAVPSKVSYRVVSRVQAKSSPERIRRRQMRRHGLSETEAHERIPDSAMTWLALPFVSIRSRSTNQTFRLFIKHSDSKDMPQSGIFNSYGLSNETTIPWF
jgi:CRISPR-associated endoribonuclease Cas6/Csy4 subtype I-F